MSTVAIWTAMDSYRAAYEGRLHDTTRALALATDAEIDTFRAAAAILAGSVSLDTPHPDLAAFRREADRAAAALGTTLALLDPTSPRDVLNTSVALGMEEDRSGWEEFRTVAETGRTLVTNLTAEGANHPGASVAVPVVRDGAVRHVLIARLEPARLSELLAAQAVPSGAFATLIDGNNVVVARSHDQERFVGQRLLDWTIEASQGQESGLLRGSNRLGEESVSAFRRLSAAPGWMLVFGYPVGTYEDALRRPTTALLLGGTIAITLALLVAYGISRRILRPVRALTRQAEAVATSGGQATSEVVPTTPVAEFEQLRHAALLAEQTLRARTAEVTAAEARLRAVVETAADAIVVINDKGTIQSFNRAATTIFGYTAEEAIGRNVSMIMRATEATRHDGHLSTYLRTGVASIMGVGREVSGRRKDDATVPIDLAIAEWRDAHGERFFTGIMRDISARKADERRKLLLTREVDHRAKNALAVVQSIIHLTPADEPRAFAAAVQGRVAALARAHSLLAEGGWAGVDLRTLVERELAPLAASARGASAAGAVTLDGPAAPLAPTVVQPLAIVLHELAANAVKHGALSQPGGRVEVSWRVGRRAGEDGMLRVRWAETGAAGMQTAPAKRGFGMRTIEATIRGQLRGGLAFKWEPPGLIAEIEVPLARIEADGDDAPDHIHRRAH